MTRRLIEESELTPPRFTIEVELDSTDGLMLMEQN